MTLQLGRYSPSWRSRGAPGRRHLPGGARRACPSIAVPSASRLFHGYGRNTEAVTLRLRLGRAAVLLLTGDHSVLDIALSCGFQSHEAFTRAFRRRFGMTPSGYRERGFRGDVDRAQASKHTELVGTIGPCIGLFHTGDNGRSLENEMTYSIKKQELAPQPVLIVRRRVKRSEIAATIAEALPHILVYAQQNRMRSPGCRSHTMWKWALGW